VLKKIILLPVLTQGKKKRRKTKSSKEIKKYEGMGGGNWTGAPDVERQKLRICWCPYLCKKIGSDYRWGNRKATHSKAQKTRAQIDRRGIVKRTSGVLASYVTECEKEMKREAKLRLMNGHNREGDSG